MVQAVLLPRRRLRRSYDEVVRRGGSASPARRVPKDRSPRAGCGPSRQLRKDPSARGGLPSMCSRARARCPPISSPPVTPELDPERLGDHLDRLYRAAWGLCGSREGAADLVQETYARVLRRPRMLRPAADPAHLLPVMPNPSLTPRRPPAPPPQQAAIPPAPPFAEPRGTV